MSRLSSYFELILRPKMGEVTILSRNSGFLIN